MIVEKSFAKNMIASIITRLRKNAMSGDADLMHFRK